MSFAPQPRHAARRSPLRGPALPIGLAVTALGVLLSIAGDAGVAYPTAATMPEPVPVAEVPAVQVGATIVGDPCADPVVQQALAAGDDGAVIAGFGGGEGFRTVVATANAPCVALDDPARVWVVVNKARPLGPVDFAPVSLEAIPLSMTTRSGQARADAAAAVGAMADAAAADGAGQIGANNGYRSYALQTTTYATHVRTQGQADADAASARPGYSEHQTGLAIDLVACDASCGAIDDFGGTPQGAWVAERAWEYGFVVRYEQGGSDVTGYMPEPWHLRYVGTALAAAYHEGGYRTLEEFFGLPAAPDYVH